MSVTHNGLQLAMMSTNSVRPLYRQAKALGTRLILRAGRVLSVAKERKDPSAHTQLFIGGLHRSGTTLVHNLIRFHPSVSGFFGTGVPEDEGQHLQTLYPPASHYGGPGHFAFDNAAHLTESDLPLVAACRSELWESWAPYWNLSRRILLEKSPPNLIRARFLQAVFPEAKFIFVVRHPLVVSAATQKWTNQSFDELIQHWVVAHQTLLSDLPRIKSWVCVRYEDLTADPKRILSELFRFIGVPPIPPVEHISDSNESYLKRLEAVRINSPADEVEVIEAFQYRLEPPYYGVKPGLGQLMSSSTEA